MFGLLFLLQSELSVQARLKCFSFNIDTFRLPSYLPWEADPWTGYLEGRPVPRVSNHSAGEQGDAIFCQTAPCPCLVV